MVGGRLKREGLDRRIGQRKRDLGARISCGMMYNQGKSIPREKKSQLEYGVRLWKVDSLRGRDRP